MNTRECLHRLAWPLIRQAKLLKRAGQYDLAMSIADRGLALKAHAWAMKPEPIPIRVDNRRPYPTTIEKKMKRTNPPRPLNSNSLEFRQTTDRTNQLEQNELSQSASSINSKPIVKNKPATRLLERRQKRLRRFAQ